MIKYIEAIHASLVNGQRKQMVEQIEDYGLYDFFDHYATWLDETNHTLANQLAFFQDAVISYFHIKHR